MDGPVADNGLPVIGPLVAFTALGWISLAMSPWLFAYPLPLIALNPKMVFLLLVAPKAGLLEFTLIASLRLCVADPFSYILGLRYGSRVRDRIERSRMRGWLMKITWEKLRSPLPHWPVGKCCSASKLCRLTCGGGGSRGCISS